MLVRMEKIEKRLFASFVVNIFTCLCCLLVLVLLVLAQHRMNYWESVFGIHRTGQLRPQPQQTMPQK